MSDFSRALRKPTPLNSIDLQCGQCGVDIDLVALDVNLRRAARSTRWTISGTARGHVYVCSIAPVTYWAARFAGGPNLLRCPHVRL